MRRLNSRRHTGAPGAVTNVFEGNHVAAWSANALTSRRAARIRSGRGVRLVSLTLLWHGGMRAARRLGVPKIEVHQTDVPGFRIELRYSDPNTGNVSMVPRSAPPCRPHPGAVHCDYGILLTKSYSASISVCVRSRHAPVRAVDAQLGTRADSVTSRQAHRWLCDQLAPEKRVEQLIALSVRDTLPLGNVD